GPVASHPKKTPAPTAITKALKGSCRVYSSNASFHPIPPFLAHLVQSLLRVLLGTFYVIDRSIQLLACCLGSPGDFLSSTLAKPFTFTRVDVFHGVFLS